MDITLSRPSSNKPSPSVLTVFIVIVALLPFSAFSTVLNKDSGFEYPILSDGTILSSASFENWDTTATPAAPPILIHRNAEANFGAQYLEFQADGSNSHTQTIGQNLGVNFAANDRFLLDVRLRRSGIAPSGNLELHILTAAGVEVSSYSIDYNLIETTWRSFTLWPATPLPEHIGGEIRIEIRAAAMGSNPAFSVFIDDIQFKTVNTAPSNIIPNSSFETRDIVAEGLAPARANSSNVDSWTFGSANSANFLFEFDGGSIGAQYIRASSVPAGSQWNYIRQDSLDGSFLNPTCTDGDLEDGICRFEITIDARYNGIAPQDQGLALADQSPTWIKLFAAGFNGANQFLMSRRKLHLWNFTDEFQTFRIKQHFPTSTIEDAPTWQLGDTVDLRIEPGSSITAGSAIDVDNIKIDRIEAPEMFKSEDLIMLDTTRLLPTRFLTDISGRARLDNGSVYRFFLPPGINIVAAGNDPAVGTPGVGKRQGNIIDVYQQPFGTAPDEWINGERYHVVELTPDDIHIVANNTVGPIYLSSTLPAETRAKIYYETSWSTGPVQPVRRSVTVLTTNFPTLAAPEHWLTSLWWMTVSDQISWPNFLQDYRSFGFNAIGGQEAWDGYITPAGEAVSPQASAYYQSARAAGYKLALNSSPWNYSAVTPLNDAARSIDAVTNLPIDGAACPAYGLMPDESIYNVSATRYTDQRDRIAAWTAAVQPEVFHLDSEGFLLGAEVSLRQNGHPGCKRCDDYLTLHQQTSPNDGMTEALIAMGVQRTGDFNAAIVAAGGSPVPEMGYYNTHANHTYQQVWDLESLASAGEATVGFSPYYSSRTINGQNFRTHLAEAQAANVSILPYHGSWKISAMVNLCLYI